MLFIFLSYYGMVVAYSLPYIWNSLKDPLPWIEEGAENFWHDTVLNSYEDLDTASGLGPIQANLAIALVCFWAIVFLTVGFGREILAKITYVTVSLPVLLIIILVLRTAFLEGASSGIKFYIGKFEAEYLLNVRTWAAACGQILFSLSPGFGTAITYSSYAKPKEDVYRACMIVAVSNILFSIVAGFATFSMVGHMAFKEGAEVADVATRDGMGLAFITMAEAMKYFGSFSNFMSVMFFSMLFLLGLDSAYALEQTLTSYVLDYFDDRGWTKPARWKVSLCTCILSTIFGLIFATRMGHELLNVVDHFVASIFLLVVTFLESIMFNLDFTYKRLEFALAKATFDNPGTPDGRRLGPKLLCKLDLHVTVPVLSGLLALYLIVADAKDVYMGYPKRLVAWGWILLSFLCVVACATLWKKDPTQLEPFDEEDIKIRETTVSRNIDDGDNIQAPEIEITSTPTALSKNVV
jgi:SNF family Na+-dependent transporter